MSSILPDHGFEHIDQVGKGRDDGSQTYLVPGAIELVPLCHDLGTRGDCDKHLADWSFTQRLCQMSEPSS
jgi:hypothetical protein